MKLKLSSFALALLLGLCGCVTAPKEAEPFRPKGELFASILVVNTGNSSYDPKKTGIEFFIESEPGVRGPCLTGYVFKESELIDIVGGGSDSAEIVKNIRRYHLTSFDYEAELRAVEDSIKSKANALGESPRLLSVLDGEEVEVRIQTPEGLVHFRAWNPGCYVDAYCQESQKFMALKQTMDELARYYGRTKFRF